MESKAEQPRCPGKMLNGDPCPNVVTRVFPDARHCYPHELQIEMDQETAKAIMPPWAMTPWIAVQHRQVCVLLGLN